MITKETCDSRLFNKHKHHTNTNTTLHGTHLGGVADAAVQGHHLPVARSREEELPVGALLPQRPVVLEAPAHVPKYLVLKWCSSVTVSKVV